MDRINHTIALDLQRGIQAQTIHVMEDDTKSRAVKFVISSGGLPFEISNFSTGEVHFRRADGTSDVYTQTNAGEAAVSVSKNVVTALIDKDITQTAGHCRMSVVLKDTYGRQIATFPINVDVIALPTWGGSGTLPAEEKKYSISRSLTNCTISNTATEIEEGEPYKATITPDIGMELTALYCTMGNTRMPVDGMSVNIAKAVGNITIVASAARDGVFVLTNQGVGSAGKTLEVDAAGNVTPGRKLDAYIKTVNGKKPDKDGNVRVEEYDDSRVRADVKAVQTDVKALQPTAKDVGRIPRAMAARQVEWVRIGQPTDDQTATAVRGWLDDHPEATTTVMDRSITSEKLSDDLKNRIVTSYVTPEMFYEDSYNGDYTKAIQDAVDTGKPVVLAWKNYRTTKPIVLGNRNRVSFTSTGGMIDYTGTDYAVYVRNCNGANISIDRIRAVNGSGICFDAENGHGVQYVNFRFLFLDVNPENGTAIAIRNDKTNGWCSQGNIYGGEIQSCKYGIHCEVGSNEHACNQWQVYNVGFEPTSIDSVYATLHGNSAMPCRFWSFINNRNIETTRSKLFDLDHVLSAKYTGQNGVSEDRLIIGSNVYMVFEAPLFKDNTYASIVSNSFYIANSILYQEDIYDVESIPPDKISNYKSGVLYMDRRNDVVYVRGTLEFSVDTRSLFVGTYKIPMLKRPLNRNPWYVYFIGNDGSTTMVQFYNDGNTYAQNAPLKAGVKYYFSGSYMADAYTKR